MSHNHHIPLPWYIPAELWDVTIPAPAPAPAPAHNVGMWGLHLNTLWTQGSPSPPAPASVPGLGLGPGPPGHVFGEWRFHRYAPGSSIYAVAAGRGRGGEENEEEEVEEEEEEEEEEDEIPPLDLDDSPPSPTPSVAAVGSTDVMIVTGEEETVRPGWWVPGRFPFALRVLPAPVPAVEPEPEPEPELESEAEAEPESEPEPEEPAAPKITIHRIVPSPSTPAVWSIAHKKESEVKFSRHTISADRTVDALVQALAFGSDAIVVYERGSGRWERGSALRRGDERMLMDTGLIRGGKQNGVVWVAET